MCFIHFLTTACRFCQPIVNLSGEEEKITVVCAAVFESPTPQTFSISLKNETSAPRCPNQPTKSDNGCLKRCCCCCFKKWGTDRCQRGAVRLQRHHDHPIFRWVFNRKGRCYQVNEKSVKNTILTANTQLYISYLYIYVHIRYIYISFL